MTNCHRLLDADGAYSNYMEPGALGDQAALDMAVYDIVRMKTVAMRNDDIKALGKNG